MITLSCGHLNLHAVKTICLNPFFSLVVCSRLPILGFLIVCFCLPASGQDTLYYNEHFDPILFPVAAQYMEVVNCDPQDSVRCVVMTFDARRSLITVMKYANYPEHILHGRCSFWYESGRMCREATYRNDKKQGVETVYYPNGQLKRKVIWDNDTIVSGSFFLEDGSPKTEVFLDDLSQEEWQKPASFPGGGDSLFYYLANTIIYPQAAMENNIQGVVMTSFVVDRKGKIDEIKIDEPVSPEIDKETIRVLQQMPRWEPARINGVPIRI